LLISGSGINLARMRLVREHYRLQNMKRETEKTDVFSLQGTKESSGVNAQ
jgi:hypothetical protein